MFHLTVNLIILYLNFQKILITISILDYNMWKNWRIT